MSFRGLGKLVVGLLAAPVGWIVADIVLGVVLGVVSGFGLISFEQALSAGAVAAGGAQAGGAVLAFLWVMAR